MVFVIDPWTMLMLRSVGEGLICTTPNDARPKDRDSSNYQQRDVTLLDALYVRVTVRTNAEKIKKNVSRWRLLLRWVGYNDRTVMKPDRW